MKNNHLIVKVSDLLKKPWKADTLNLENIQCPWLDTLREDWLSFTVDLKSTNDQSIFVVLSDILYTEKLVCDSCTAEYKKPCTVKEYTAKFICDEAQEQDDDVVFYISDDQTIDLAPMLEQAVVLNRDIANYCEHCHTDEITDNDDDTEYFESTSNVRFI